MQNTTILLVEDDPNDTLFFKIALANADRDTRLQTVSDGKHAHDYLWGISGHANRSQHPWPDLVVLDLQMPCLSGLDVLAWMKGSASLAAVPVVILTGSLDPNHMQLARRLGADSFVLKPAGLEGWNSAIADILSLLRPAAVQPRAPISPAQTQPPSHNLPSAAG